MREARERWEEGRQREAGRRALLRGAAMLGAALVMATAPAYAMHISDGVLGGIHPWIWWGLSAPFVALAVRDLNRRKAKDLNYVPLLAMVGAAVFILSVFHVPVAVAGSSSHPTGGALAAILVGPLPAVLINAIALLLQALFLGHGGILSLGANTFSMGVVGVFFGYGVYVALGRLNVSLFVRAAVAAFLSNLVGTYGTAALQLALALHGDRTIAQMWLFCMAGYLPTQLPLAVLDGAIAGYMCEFIVQRRPDIARHVGLLRSRTGVVEPQPAR